LIQQQIKEKIDARIMAGKRAPGLAVILVGDDPASQIYVGKKRQTCEKVGIKSFAYDFPSLTTQDELVNLVADMNKNPEVDGILVQMPLPNHIDKSHIVETILPSKDVDGFHPYNIGRLVRGEPLLRPCTPYGIMSLFEHYDIAIKGKNV